jgi:hypothetical protein
MANDAPYDGMAIGAHLGDAIRNVVGTFGYVLAATQTPSNVFYIEETFPERLVYNYDNGYFIYRIKMDLSRVVPTALENRPVSISALICITY